MRYMALDIETIGLKPYGGTIWMVAYTDKDNKVKLEHDCYGIKKLPSSLVHDLQNPLICKVIHNASFDVTYLALVLGVQVRNVWDTRLCEIVIQGTQVPRGSRNEKLAKQHSSSLKYTLPRYGFESPDKNITKQFVGRNVGVKFTKEEIEYAMGDVRYLCELQKAQEFLLTRDGLLEVGLLENQTVEKVCAMRIRGIGIDTKVWKEIARLNTLQHQNLMRKLPTGINWNSPAQVKAYFRNRGVALDSLTNAQEVYDKSKDSHLKAFIDARELYKSVTTYGYSWLEGTVDSDSRVRCDAEQIVNTGRFSLSNPNLQQLPSKGKHRSAFVPAKGHKFVIGDFTGQEIGIMAAAGDEKIWIEALLRGEDVHSLTASMLYGSVWHEQTEKGCKFPKKCSCKGHSLLRNEAKVLNFMLAYGGGPMKFAERTGVDELSAKITVRKYKRVVKKLTAWLDKNGREAALTAVSYSADPYRRRRVLKGEEEWQVINQGKNNPIQAAGANMLKLTMISMPEKFPIVLVIHDEVVLEVPTKQAKAAAAELKIVMEQSADHITGIKGLIKVTPRIATNLTKE